MWNQVRRKIALFVLGLAAASGMGLVLIGLGYIIVDRPILFIPLGVLGILIWALIEVFLEDF